MSNKKETDTFPIKTIAFAIGTGTGHGSGLRVASHDHQHKLAAQQFTTRPCFFLFSLHIYYYFLPPFPTKTPPLTNNSLSRSIVLMWQSTEPRTNKKNALTITHFESRGFYLHSRENRQFNCGSHKWRTVKLEAVRSVILVSARSPCCVVFFYSIRESWSVPLGFCELVACGSWHLVSGGIRIEG